MKQLNAICLNILLALTGLAVPSFIMAQEAQLKTSLLSPFVNTLNLSAQFKLAQNSVNFTASYMTFENDEDFYRNNIKGGCLTGEYRIHLSDAGNRCWYLAPFGRIMYYQNHRTSSIQMEEGKYTSLGVGFVGGRQYALHPKITLEWFIGPALQFSLSEDRSLTAAKGTNIPVSFPQQRLTEFISNNYLNGYGFRCGINIGFIL